ncbi:MAG: OFA family MFS transporter [Parasporobacterium sp.]|nr:OFA family MFS transporter [Parasporobacterium sp.]
MKHLNRWVYAIIGVIVLIFAGMVYAWTVLSSPIAAQFTEWSKADLSLTFTIVMFFFCIGTFLGGIFQKKMKVKWLAWIAAVLFILGFFIASRATSLMVLYAGFGVLGGLGSGFSYSAVLSSVTKWFPDKQGLMSGILLMGFGIGSFIIGKIYTAVTPSDGGEAWRTSFLVLGIICFVVLGVSGFFTRIPDPSWQAPAPKKAKAQKEIYEEINTVTMLKRPSFWLFFFWAIFLSAAGLAVVSQGTPMALEACPDAAISDVATIVGLISIFNGIGRIIFGLLYDKIGRTLTMLLGGIVFIAAMLLVLWALTSHSMTILVISYITVGLGYGCVTPTNSAFTYQYYGSKDYPTNLSIINMNLLIASFGSTIAGAIFDATNSYVTIIIVVLALIVVGTILSFLIRKPKPKAKDEPKVM